MHTFKSIKSILVYMVKKSNDCDNNVRTLSTSN